jgi:membrane protease YdiL (CAAX protease family)
VTLIFRSTCIVLGITSLALLAQQMAGMFRIMHAVAPLTYGLAAIAAAYGVARPYWRNLFPVRFSIATFAISAAAGLLFAMFFNHPAQQLLANLHHGRPAFSQGMTFDGWTLPAINLNWNLFGLQTLATVLVTPFAEELIQRGILFAEMFGAAIWQAAVLSFTIFCLSQLATGGMTGVLTLMPATLLFIAIRCWSGSFIYAFVAHATVNAAMLLGLQVT